MWFVAIDHKYYPEIYIVNDEQEAEKQAEKALARHHDDDGVFEGKIVYGEVKKLIEIRTNY